MPEREPPNPSLQPRLRLVRGGRRVLGPGRADLLDGVRETGSIAAAGRRMGMSYKRAWSLVEDLNTSFAAPLVEMHRGGSGHGGASLTALGTEILETFRRMQAVSDAAIEADLDRIARHMAAPT